MTDQRPPYTVIISETYERACYHLAHMEPPINPKARTTIILTDAARALQKIRGYRFDESAGDQFIWESGPAGHYDTAVFLIEELSRRGFPPRDVRQ